MLASPFTQEGYPYVGVEVFRMCLEYAVDDAKELVNARKVCKLWSKEVEACRFQEAMIQVQRHATDMVLRGLRRFVSIRKVSLSGCFQITDVGVEHISALEYHQYMNLRQCGSITDVGL